MAREIDRSTKKQSIRSADRDDLRDRRQFPERDRSVSLSPKRRLTVSVPTLAKSHLHASLEMIEHPFHIRAILIEVRHHDPALQARDDEPGPRSRVSLGEVALFHALGD